MADRKIGVMISITSEISKKIVERADKEGKNLDDVIFEVLLKEFETVKREEIQ
jgi:hypothetical protein